MENNKNTGWLLMNGEFICIDNSHLHTATWYIQKKDRYLLLSSPQKYQYMFNEGAIRVASGYQFQFPNLNESILNRIKDFINKNNMPKNYIILDDGKLEFKLKLEDIQDNGIWSAYIRERRMNRVSSKLINILKISNINIIKKYF
jgi:hypothetical protein